MQLRVVFTRFGHNTAMGNFGPGDVAVVGASMARHLVETVGCAQYETHPTGQAPSAPSQAVTKAPRGKRAAKGRQQAVVEVPPTSTRLET